jgi:hypothetical protein
MQSSIGWRARLQSSLLGIDHSVAKLPVRCAERVGTEPHLNRIFTGLADGANAGQPLPYACFIGGRLR